MDEKRETISVQCYPYGELIYVVKRFVKMNGGEDSSSQRAMECDKMRETNLTAMAGTNLSDWKWNYLYDTIANNESEQTETVDAPTEASANTKAENTLPNTDHLLPEHAFYTDFNEFSLSLVKKESFSYHVYDSKETDLLGFDDIRNEEGNEIRETDLTVTDEEFTDVSSLSSYATSNAASMTKLNSSVLSIPTETTDDNRNSCAHRTNGFAENTQHSRSERSNDDLGIHGDISTNIDEVESDYFETDCETMDSGIFPHKDTEYFQDIGSDFFDDEEDDDDSPKASSKTVNDTRGSTSNDDKRINVSPLLSPTSHLPKGKTATMSNSLLRSTISELERALNDSNTLLATRDEKIQRIRSRNLELKKTLAKEIENNTHMKHLLIEKDKIILEKQSKIIELNQEIHDINDTLSKLRSQRFNESRASVASLELSDSGNNSLTRNEVSTSTPNKTAKTPDCDTSIKSPNAITSPCRSNKSLSCRFSKISLNNENVDSSDQDLKTPVEEDRNARDLCSKVDEQVDDKANEKLRNEVNEAKTNGEMQLNLRMKFLRDAFFYYMIGFHPDEQMNAILAILEYGDRRQEFVLEAHTMRKSGKKFNVSKVSSRGHSFVQEEFE